MMWKKTFLLAAFASVTLCDSITDCHAHGSVYYCVNTDGVEASISPAPTGNLKPSSYTSCHNHGSETYCMNGDDEVRFMVETTAEKSSASITSMSAQTTAVTGCHLHGATQFCLDGKGNEGYMSPVPTNTKSAPVSYTGCHAHATETYCLNADGEEVNFWLRKLLRLQVDWTTMVKWTVIFTLEWNIVSKKVNLKVEEKQNLVQELTEITMYQ